MTSTRHSSYFFNSHYFCAMAKSSDLKYEDLLSAFQKGQYEPIYIFHGEEEFFIDSLAQYIETHALDEAEQAFNQVVVYGRDVQAGSVRDMAMRLPMMAPRQVIIIREAQDMKDLIHLESYIERPNPSTLLVICHKHKKLDARTKFAKAATQKGVVFESKRLYDNKIPAWIEQYVKEAGYGIAIDALALCHEYLGNQLNTIAGQLEKLYLKHPKGTQFTIAHIQESIGLTREYNVFELQKAIGLRQMERTFYILSQMAKDAKSNSAVVVISSLAGYFGKLWTMNHMPGAKDDEVARAISINPFMLKEYRPAQRHFNNDQLARIFGLLHDYDLRSKGLGQRTANDGELLRELVHHIMAA